MVSCYPRIRREHARCCSRECFFASCCVWTLVGAAVCVCVLVCCIAPQSSLCLTTETPKCDHHDPHGQSHTYPMVGAHRSHQSPTAVFSRHGVFPRLPEHNTWQSYSIPPARSSAPRGSQHPDATSYISYLVVSCNRTSYLCPMGRQER